MGLGFLVAVPTMLVLVLTVPFLVPEFRSSGTGRLDLVSVAMSLVTPLAIVYGIKGIAADGPGFSSLGFIVLGLVVGAAFVRRQRRLATPLLDLSLFRIPAFSISAGGMIVGMLLFGTSLLTSQYLQLVLGYAPLKAGLWQLPTAVGGTVVALWVSGLGRPPPARRADERGAAFAVLGPIMLTQVDGGPELLAARSPAPFRRPHPVHGPGHGPGPPARLRPKRAGAASAISETGAELAVRWASPRWAVRPPPSTAATWPAICPRACPPTSPVPPARRCPRP
ncbi:MFS transporter [Streptomyces tanashiensis]